MVATIRITGNDDTLYTVRVTLPRKFCQRYQGGLGLRIAGELLGANWGWADVSGETMSHHEIGIGLPRAEELATAWANDIRDAIATLAALANVDCTIEIEVD